MLAILLVAVVLVLLCNVALLAVVLATLARARRMVDEVQDQARAFFIAPDPNTPSAFADLVDKSAAILSARLISSAQAAIRGSAGGAAKAANEARQLEMVEANPLMGLQGLLGGKLGKSPLATLALSFLGSKLMGGGSPGSNGSGNAAGGSGRPWGFK